MPETVLIVDDRRDIFELNRILLESEGYQAIASSYKDATPEVVLEAGAQVVLLDLVPGDEAPWALLELLRQNAATRDLGVVVTSDSPALVERAMSDCAVGVSAGLVMPFDIEALFAAIRRAARGGRASAEVDSAASVMQIAAEAIRGGRRPILVRWIQRLSTLNSFRERPNLSLEELKGRGEALIDGVADAMSLCASSRVVPAASAGISAQDAREHARLRRAQGIGQADVAREMASLKGEIWREVSAAVGTDPPALQDVWVLLGRFQLALDESLFVMLDSYTESGMR